MRIVYSSRSRVLESPLREFAMIRAPISRSQVDPVLLLITKPVGEPGMKSNDRMELHGIIPIKLQVSHLKEASGVTGKLFSSI
jgi:hypothetical protein